MFTGIVEEAQPILSFTEGATSWRLVVAAKAVLKGLAIGDSIAVNGCCLTAVCFDESSITFDLLGETVRLTSFAKLSAGTLVNLERSLRFDGKVGGHFVTGHIDGLGAIYEILPSGKDVRLTVCVGSNQLRYLIYKGSIAIDGISLTVAEVNDKDSTFTVWLIPHTLEVTNLRNKRAGDSVNLEFDLLGKYVERLMQRRGQP